MGLIQMFCIDLKVMCIERPRHPEHCVKRADPDVKRFPRYYFSKLDYYELWAMARDRGKFQTRKTAMAAHYSLLHCE